MNLILVRYNLAVIIRPLLVRIPIGAGRIYRFLFGSDFASHRVDKELRAQVSDLSRVFYDRRIGAFVSVDLGDWAGREHYFTGRYHDSLVPAMIQLYLADGGTFVDVGANRGLHTLFAAKLLNNINGDIHAFEPNPQVFQILEAHLVLNGFLSCETYNIGLSDARGLLSLHVPPSSGQASFRDDMLCDKDVSVSIETLDDVLGMEALKGPILVKIDTEGFEHNVIKGMRKILDDSNVSVVCEVTDSWLRKTGSSAQLLFDDMKGFGFSAYLCKFSKFSLSKKNILFREIRQPLEGRAQYDVLFTRDKR